MERPNKCTNSVEVNGVHVRFPFQPYPLQKDLMQSVISALQQSNSALIESPTGTGKTLCLLCACIAWRESLAALRKVVDASNGLHDAADVSDPQLQALRTAVFGKQAAARMHSEPSLPNTNSSHNFVQPGSATTTLSENGTSTIFNNSNYNPPAWSASETATAARAHALPQIPKIFYASRTHSQLSQVVAELYRTGLSVRSTVLGSRDQMCINTDVLNAPPASRSARCRIKITTKSCSHYAKAVADRGLNTIAPPPIVDIEELVSFGRKHSACPYFLAKGSVESADIVFLPYNYLVDPAIRKSQNIDLKNAIIIFDEGHNLESICSEVTSFDISTKDLSNAMNEIAICLKVISMPKPPGQLTRSTSRELSKHDLQSIQTTLSTLKENILGIVLGHDKQLTEVGAYLIDIFQNAGITRTSYEAIISIIDACVDLLVSGTEKGHSSSKLALRTFKSALEIASRAGSIGEDAEADQGDAPDPTTKTSLSYYRVHIHEATVEVESENRSHAKIPQSLRSKTIVLSFWCFNSGVAMQTLMRQKVRSVILASGTLAPLDGFEPELGIPFPIKLENSHVINPSQIFVGIVPTGPSGVKLSSSQLNRRNVKYIPELGNAIVNFARVVPDGVLVFFTAYKVMTDCIDAWKRPSQTGKSIWEQLTQYKVPIVERRTKQEFSQDIQLYEQIVESNNDRSAIFFAVCRGKASEGIDFSDRKGRAVIICGIPYPACRDARVVIKREIMDAEARQFGGINGNEWYSQQASRAVNQAIGRVIRHRRDYGAIMLLDERFAHSTHVRQLPKWVRGQVKVLNNFGQAQTQMYNFFKNIPQQMELLSSMQNAPSMAGSAPAAESQLHHSVSDASNNQHVAARSHSARTGSTIIFHKTQVERLATHSYPTRNERRGLMQCQDAFPVDQIPPSSSTHQSFSNNNTSGQRGMPHWERSHAAPPLDQSVPSTHTGQNRDASDAPKRKKDYESRNAQESHGAKRTRSADAPQFLAQLKIILTRESYKSMQKLFKLYYSKSIGIDDMITRSFTILLEPDEAGKISDDRLQLVRDFRTFFGSRHHSVFDKHLDRVIAETNNCLS